MPCLEPETREDPVVIAEKARVAHWWRSKRGPAFLAPLLFLLGFETHIAPGQVVADIGCGWGHYSFQLAEQVGATGKVYAVDLAEKCIRKIQRKAEKRGFQNVTAVTSSAAELGFIPDQSVDVVFANGLLCSMACDRSAAVSEIQRILKPDGVAYLSLGAQPPMGYVDENEWNEILAKFEVISGGSFSDMWVLVKQKVPAA